MSEWLIWAMVGVALVIAEVLTMSFVLVFFGIGALIVAFLIKLGILTGFNTTMIVFAVCSLLLLAVMRRFIKSRFAGTKDRKPDYLDQLVLVVKTIPVGEEGTVSYRGSDWIAFGDHDQVVPAGEKVKVVGIDGIRLKVERIHPAVSKEKTE